MMAIHLFSKKETILETKDEAACKAALEALEAAGIWHNSWTSEAMPVGGCGAKIRPQDWGAGVARGANDELRKTWHVEVLTEDADHARELIGRPAK